MPGRTERQRLLQTAYHEAGHAVAAFWLRRHCKYVTIEPDPDRKSLGHLRNGPLPKTFNPELNEDARTRWRVEREIIILLAGDAAEQCWRGRRTPPEGQQTSDWHGAVDLASYMAPHPRTCRRYVDYLSARAYDLIAWRLLWPAVKALAHALMKHRTLTWTQARRVIQTALQRDFEQNRNKVQQATP